MLRHAVTGDRVWHTDFGWGVVLRTDMIGGRPIIVEFSQNRELFSIDGKLSEYSKYQTLFWDEIKFEIPKKPLPDLKVDTKVLVWDMRGDAKVRRHLKEINKDGYAVCYEKGATSWSTTTFLTSSWENWELAE